MPAVTISAGYGAGGSVVARAVAERLGYQLLDRAISSQVAERLNVTVEEAEDATVRRSFAERFFGVLAPMAGGVIGDPDGVLEAALPANDAELFRAQAEAIMRAALPDGAVILGRAGAAALREEPGVLRVRLFGPKAARIRQAARVQEVDEQTAARRLPQVDAARATYVKRLYGADIDDPALFHLHLDSTVLPLETCAELIVTAYTATK
ncbi:MAG TPA: cytidylate kinase-like family protein [Jatrophihabitans sp.]|jgi:cytidylate kinase|nr:cytidylate kinase-like family protein [Jatrophihabitans sp.]